MRNTPRLTPGQIEQIKAWANHAAPRPDVLNLFQSIAGICDDALEYRRREQINHEQMKKWAPTFGAQIDYSDVGGEKDDVCAWQWPDICVAADDMHNEVVKLRLELAQTYAKLTNAETEVAVLEQKYAGALDRITDLEVGIGQLLQERDRSR